MTDQSPQSATPTIAETFGARLASLTLDDIPAKARETAINDLLDMAGLCIAARNTDYVHALIEGWDGEGNCTAIGHPKGMDAAGAALVNGTSTHGEDFDDTLEGTPIRVGAMVIPAALAAAERFGRTGADALLGITLGLETVCRLNQVAPGAMHKACFHPVGVIGVFGGAAGAGAALGLDAGQMANAIAISSSLASGILEYLTDGAWTKRLHPGWAAHSGLRAALFARAGYSGPRTVFEGGHNYFRAFAPSATPNYGPLTEGLGEEWLMEGIAFKPYACGTMIHPFIDCTIRLAAPRRQAPAADGLCRQVLDAVLHGRRLLRRRRRARPVYRREGQGPAHPGARFQDPLRHRSRRRISGQLFRPHQGDDEGR